MSQETDKDLEQKPKDELGDKELDEVSGGRPPVPSGERRIESDQLPKQ